jgi:hypothetical protein
LSDIAGRIAQAMPLIDAVAVTALRQALWNSEKKVARRLQPGPQAGLYATTFGAMLLLGDGLTTVHKLVEGGAEDVGPTYVGAVLKQKGIDALYGDVLSACQLSMGVLCDNRGLNMQSSWELSQRAFNGWPAGGVDATMASLSYLGWMDVAVLLKKNEVPGLSSIMLMAEISVGAGRNVNKGER